MNLSFPLFRFACAIVAALSLAGSLHAAPQRFVVWNIEWFPGLRPTASAKEADAHMKACKRALAKMNPDIFVAQEIRDWAAFQELCSAVPGLTVHVVSSFRDANTGEIRNQQIGIASKLVCRAAWWENWQDNYPEIRRGFSFAALEHPDGGLLMVYGNHLKSNAGSNTPEGAANVAGMRNEQARQLLSHIETVQTAFAHQPILGWIASGDFNTNHDGDFPGCRVVELLTEGGYFNTWTDTPKEKRLTWRGDKNERFKPTTFDYIFTKGLKEVDAHLIEVPRELSDHYPLTIDVIKP